MPKRSEHEAIKKKHQESLTRIKRASQSDSFLRDWRDLIDNWKTLGYPDLSNERNADFDKAKRRTIYYGLYYDLRDLCDGYGLTVEDGAMLWELCLTQSPDALAPRLCPPPEHWQWFRMAREGLGMPTKEEKNKMGLSAHLHRRNFSRGLSYAAIANTTGKTEVTIRNAVNDCQKYIDRGGFDFGEVGKLAGLDFYQSFALLIPHQKKGTKTK